jgi:fermentation-respiration switch protein FrsA (DUF1100 family)
MPPIKMKAVYSLAAVLLVLYCAICLIFYVQQRRLLYLPTPESSPPGATAMRLPVAQATLKIWQLHPQATSALIYFGGNAEEVAGNLPDFDAAFPDRAIYLVNYRGYGGSTGSPSEAALVADAQAVFDWVRTRHEHIAVMGRSLGTGVASALAASRPVERLVLVTPFDSIVNVAGDHFRWLPVRWILKDRFDSLLRMASLRVPVLILVAEHDEVIFRQRSDALIAAVPAKNLRTVVVPQATHNDIESFPEYLPAIRDFFDGP